MPNPVFTLNIFVYTFVLIEFFNEPELIFLPYS